MSIDIGSVATTPYGDGVLMVDGAPVDRKTAVKAIGCSEMDFNRLLLGYANGIAENGLVHFADTALAKVQLFCLQQMVRNNAAV